jgi:hypothetical protein
VLLAPVFLGSLTKQNGALRTPIPSNLRCSIHSLFNCLPAGKFMIKRENPLKIHVWEINARTNKKALVKGREPKGVINSSIC